MTNTPQTPPEQTTTNTATEKRQPIRIGSQRSATDLKKVSSATQSTSSPAPAEEAAPPVAVATQVAVPENPAVVTTPATPELETTAPVAEQPPAETTPPPTHAPVRKEPVGIPQLTSDMEAEIEAAMGGLSLDEMIAEGSIEAAEVELDVRRRATVTKVHRDNVFFTLNVQHEGVTSLKHFKEPPEVGAALDIIVNSFNAEEGLYEVSIPGASASVGDWDDITEGMVVEARVTGANTGGLECLVNTLRGFIPASQISIYRVENLPEYVDKRLQCVVTEAKPERRNLVLSHRAIMEREKEESREQLLQQIEVGQIREGTVRSLRDFGAFVDIGGIDGLVHISKMSWDHIKHPSEVLKEGQTIKVTVEKIDPQTGKIGLSYRDSVNNPWNDVEANYPPGSTVTGTVTRVAPFGAFVKLQSGVEGLIHISELSHQRVSQVGRIVQEEQTVEVKVLTVDQKEQRISLSLKATQASPEAPVAEEAPLTERVVPKRTKPLKGGTGGPSGGDKFGLNW